MIERSYDPDLAKRLVALQPRPADIDWSAWLGDEKNVMLASDENIGMGTYEYPGLYTVHWFFNKRGKEALALAKEMLTHFFEHYPVESVRGLTAEEFRGARWLARKVGLKSYGFLDFPEARCELFCMTKQEFYEGNK